MLPPLPSPPLPSPPLPLSPLDPDVVRALLGDEDAREYSDWLRSTALMEQHAVLQPYELLAERHLAMDMERYLQVGGYTGRKPRGSSTPPTSPDGRVPHGHGPISAGGVGVPDKEAYGNTHASPEKGLDLR